MSRTLERQLSGSREPLSCARCIQPSCPARSIARSRALNREHTAYVPSCIVSWTPFQDARFACPGLRVLSRALDFSPLRPRAAKSRAGGTCKLAARALFVRRWLRSGNGLHRVNLDSRPAGHRPPVTGQGCEARGARLEQQTVAASGPHGAKR